MKKDKIYISGRMTNGDKKELTVKGFFEAEKKFRDLGFEVFNPARLESGGTWEEYIVRDLIWIIENKPRMYMLRGWYKSDGAILEYETARKLSLRIDYERILD